MPKLITDLAIMLLTAAVVAVLFKKIKKPLVLGYILAGFLVGPFMPYFFTVEDSHSIETWSEIGIIVLMFSLGLEFNLHKLISVGKTAVITAMVEVFGMLVIGYSLGQAMGWPVMDSIFLGGMLSMSSTTIIIKAFDELQVREKGFAQLVFGTLVIEDIAGIFMMIILSTVSVSKNISGGALALQLGEMVLYLALWLIIGIFVLPTILRTASKFMNDEVLLIMSLGICFGMVLIAEALGFSSALGAFLAGSLLAGTVLAEKVEHLTSSIKDLFGAVFFLSVGMMIDPEMLVKYFLPILIVTVVTLIGKLTMSALGVLLSGRGMDDAIHCGCSLAQIGEFAFIIASLGMSLGVISDYVYPIIVAVSVVTTLTTPAFIKAAPRIEALAYKLMPEKLKEKIDSSSGEGVDDQDDSDWMAFLRRYIRRTALFGAIMTGISLISRYGLYPALMGIASGAGNMDASTRSAMGVGVAKAICVLFSVVGIGIFVRPMLDLRSPEYTTLWVKNRGNRLPLISLTVIRFILIVVITFFYLQTILGIPAVLLLVLIALAIVVAYKSGWLASAYISAEARFMVNLNERRLQNLEVGDTEWLDDKLFVDYLDCNSSCRERIIGRELKDLDWGRRFGVNVFKVIRDKKHINMPNGGFSLEGGDRVFFIGPAENIRAFHMALDLVQGRELPSLRAFINNQKGEPGDVYDYPLPIKRDSEFQGTTIKESKIREKYDCMVIGLQRDKLPILQPDTNTVMQRNDLVWILGSSNMAEKLLADDKYASHSVR